MPIQTPANGSMNAEINSTFNKYYFFNLFSLPSQLRPPPGKLSFDEMESEITQMKNRLDYKFLSHPLQKSDWSGPPASLEVCKWGFCQLLIEILFQTPTWMKYQRKFGKISDSTSLLGLTITERARGLYASDYDDLRVHTCGPSACDLLVKSYKAGKRVCKSYRGDAV